MKMWKRFRRKGVGVIELAVAIGLVGGLTALNEFFVGLQGCVPEPGALPL
jgi:hypothetical protein